MMSFFTPRSGKQKRMAKTQLVALTAALLLALVVLPVAADHEDEVEYTSAYEDASKSVDAGSARLAALGQFYGARSLEASHAASTGRYEALASFFGQGDSVVIAQNGAELAANPELKSFSSSAEVASDVLATISIFARGWGGSSASVANSGVGSENPELSAVQRYCGC